MAATAMPKLGGPVVPTWLRRVARYGGLIVPIGFVLMLGALLVPMPPWLMDVLLAANISLSVIILLTTVYMDHPLDFSVFPSLLVAATLLRLTLNIASTRLILTADASSPAGAVFVAGHVIRAFGDFVAGDSLFVGGVIFLILVVVQFLVITKGATRISEVAARFTLDAMPGKQMAIDSDLNAGIIDDKEARRRRERISQEADFFGAMDGASKFVRGDAIAGVVITVINILGGVGVGAVERGWPLADTADVFTRLTIGDGLASQIPSFIIAVSTALIVTRSGSRAQLGDELTGQITSQPRGLAITSIFLALLAFTPLPALPLLATSGGLGLIAWGMSRSRREAESRASQGAPTPGAGESPPIEALLKVDTLELEIGYGLVPLVDPGQGGDLLDRVQSIRRQLAAEVGFVMPPVRIRDNLQLPAHAYRLKVRGSVVARGETRPGLLLAMDPGLATGPIGGEPTKEPAFGLDAWWIDPTLRARAETMNYTVVDGASVLATHLTEVVRRHADELLTRDEVANLLEQLKRRSPKLVEEAVPGAMKAGELQRLLQALLRERVPIRDLESILETVVEWAPKTKDTDVLVEYVRHALRRVICDQHAAPGEGARRRIACVTLDPALEDLVAGHVERGPSGTTITMPARLAARVGEQVSRAMASVTATGAPPVVITSPQVRAPVRQIVEPHVPGLVVLGYNEIAPDIDVESLALVLPPAEADRLERTPAAAA